MSPDQNVEVRKHGHVTNTACLNCNAPLAGQFCSECGQRDVPPYPSVRELVIETLSELSGWDGRFVGTMRALFERPGKLTLEFLEGRRARYISPLRLYLMTSLLYFLIASLVPRAGSKSDDDKLLKMQVSAVPAGAAMTRPQRVITAATKAFSAQRPVAADERAAVLRDVQAAPAVMRPFLQRAIEDPAGFRKGLLDAIPRMLFVLVPVFAGVVALFYRGKKFPEHLYFAIHLQTFVFLALGTSALVRFARIPALTGPVRLIVFIWIAVYTTLAFRRVYGGSILRTLVKQVGIGVLYSVTSLVAFLVTLFLVSVAG